MKLQHGLASHESILRAGKVARMSSRRSSAAARQSVKRDSLASCILTYTCQLSAKRRLFQLFLLLTSYTDDLPGAKNIDRHIPLHTPFTNFNRCRPTSAPVCVSHLIGRVFTSFGLCSHCLFVNGVHIVWAHVVVDVITLIHVRIVWADLFVRHMGLSNSGPLGFGWLICSGSAHCVYAMPTLSTLRMSSDRGYCLPRFDVFGRLMRFALIYAVAPFLYSACLFWVDRVDVVSYSFVVTHVLEDIITLDRCPYLGRMLRCTIDCSNDPCPRGCCRCLFSNTFLIFRGLLVSAHVIGCPFPMLICLSLA